MTAAESVTPATKLTGEVRVAPEAGEQIVTEGLAGLRLQDWPPGLPCAKAAAAKARRMITIDNHGDEAMRGMQIPKDEFGPQPVSSNMGWQF
jgi:hypothetical protein